MVHSEDVLSMGEFAVFCGLFLTALTIGDKVPAFALFSNKILKERSSIF
jgi:hypothetical protein